MPNTISKLNTTIPTILVFDSGVGGLSIYQEVKQLLPNCNYLYCFDNAFFPYSEKTEQQIIQRTLKICQYFNDNFPLDIIIIACNTASTVALPALRASFDCHIVGTVPAIKPAALISRSKTIGLLATKGTISRSYVADLIDNYAQDCQVEKIGTTKLVEIAEQKLHGHSVDLIALWRELSPWHHRSELDTVILGCTHFPLLKQEIAICLPQVKYFVDSGKAIAQRVKFLLNQTDCSNKELKITNSQLFCTALLQDKNYFKQIMQQQWQFTDLQILSIF